ncbi:MAG: hypothetical protein Q8K71_08330 [Polaromonas sp.]|uniref:hypothetical protein n=1 Tax=Polaromonas sp. TaxID=1869339 RepID=UPI00272F78BB|nr:hypothetical protein [Polaromonas sp.]MDP1742331.1 hypothetical protein [Polaromonas sp.]MDP1954471.1 hypothetical protein [Polaromonas sp.]MDP3753560.1 hypothetical protein [Polaromonas sp.]
MADFVIVIAQQSVHLYRFNGAIAEAVASADADEDPMAWVAAHMPARGNCSLVSDIMDEAYIRNVLPPIWLAGTRDQLLQRRLLQQLRDNPYRAAVLTPSGSWRPPTRATLIALGQSERIALWLEALTARRVRVKGLWPLSALIALEVKSKAPRRPRAEPAQAGVQPEPASLRPTLALVATPAGLRQVLVRGKSPLFSRLALSVGEGSLSASFVLAEARRTVQYLISQEWLGSADQPVSTQMWLPFDDDQALQEVAEDPALDVQFIEAVDDAYARLLPRLKSVSAQLQFLPDESRIQWRAAQLGATAKYGGIAALVLAGLWSADLLWLSWGKRSQAQAQSAQADAINEQANQEILRAKGDLSQAGLAVATVQAWQQTVAVQPDQFAGLQRLANALQLAPGVEVQKISWQLPSLQVQTPGVAPAATAPFACPKAATAIPAAEANPPAEPPKPAVALLTLAATLPLNLTQRQALQMQDGLLASLTGDGWTASVLKSTITLDPVQVQTGTLGEVAARTLELCVQKAAP